MLVTVLLVTFVLLILVAGTIAYAVGSQPLSRRDQDWNAALSSAEAGLDDYLYRLNQNDQYYLYGQTTATAPCNTALPAPPDGNLAFGQFVPVPGTTSNATFRYCVDTSYLSQGAIVVWSTGKAANVTRTVQATFRRRSFIDYLYFTDYETTDPAAYPVAGFNTNNSTWAQANCTTHYYESRPSAPPYNDSNCVDINFASGDVINGPLHSNDAILICGSATFNGKVTTSWQGAGSPIKRFRSNSTCSPSTANPTFANSGDPKYADPLTMPPSNLAIKVKADKDLGGLGCLFTGPTKITLNGAGTMTVISPLTKSSATDHNNCAGGTVASPATQAIPANGVIYVQNMPGSSSDTNFSATCTPGTQLASGTSTGGTATNPLGYPQYTDMTIYGCTDGDVFLSGTLKGRLTIAADNNIEIIEDVNYATGTGGSDLLGLVANNFIEIYHPVDQSSSSSSQTRCDGSYVSSGGDYYCNLKLPGASQALRDPIINAAMLSVNHSFRVQNYQYGASGLGTITVNGAIAQRYRGTVGTGSGSTGYLKNYNYDQRMKYQSPPFFLNPIDSAWQIVTWVECKGTNNGSVPTTCQ